MQEAADVTVAVEPALSLPVVVGLIGAGAASVVALARLSRRLREGRPVIASRPHPPASWSGGEVALIALVYMALLAATGLVVSSKATLREHLLANVVTNLVATAVGVGLLRAAGVSWAALGFVGGRWSDDLRLALGGLAVVLAPLLGIAAVLDRLVPYRHPVVSFLQDGRDPTAILLVVVAAVVAAPIAEEFFFRRVLQGWLETRFPEADGAAAIGLSAAAFAAAHVGHGLAPAPLFILGIVLGIVARRTGSLVPCVLLHALFNAVSVGLLLVSPAAPAAGGG